MSKLSLRQILSTFLFIGLLPYRWAISYPSDILIPVLTTTKEHLPAKIVSEITLKFIYSYTPQVTVMTATSSTTSGHRYLHGDIISNLITLTHQSLTYRFTGINDAHSSHYSFYLFLVDTYEGLEKLLLNFILKRLRLPSTSYYFVIITRSYNDTNDAFLNKLFESCFAKSILHINFLLPHNNHSTWLMTTYLPFVKSCNTLQKYNIALLTEKNYSFGGSMESIYPNKLKDFHQCPVIVAVFNTPPFIIIKGSVTHDVYDGIDTRILRQFANKFNFKLIYRVAPDKQNRGTIYPNGTITGCIHMVVHGSANLTLGAFMTTPNRNSIMTPSHTYMQATVGFAILPMKDIATPLEKLLAPFRPSVWLCIGLCIASAMAIISVTKKLSRTRRHFVIGGRFNSTPILNMFNTFLGGVIGNPLFTEGRYLSTFARSILMVWLLGCLIIRGSYQGALYDFLQRQNLASPFDTIEKINESDCNLVIMSTATSSLDTYYFAKDRHLVYNYSQQIVFRQLYDMELSGAVYCSDLQMKYFNLMNAPRRVLQLTKNRLFLMSVVAYFNNASVLKSIFDDEIMALIDSGLIDFWTREYVDERIDGERYRQRMPSKLNLKNIYAIIEICGCFLVFCCIVFGLEKISNRFARIKTFIDKITY